MAKSLLAASLAIVACAHTPEATIRPATRAALHEALTDVPTNHPNATAIYYVVDHGLMTVENNHFNPNAPVLRGKMLHIFMDAAGGYTPLSPAPTPPFSDVPVTHPEAPYIYAAAERHIVRGRDDGEFHPDAIAHRVEALKMLLLAYREAISASILPNGDNYTDMTTPGLWYIPFGRFAHANNLFDADGEGSMQRDADMNRAQTAELLWRYSTHRIRTTQAPITSH